MENNKPDRDIKSQIKNSWPYMVLISFIALVAFYIRIRPSESVFISEDFIRFGGNDPWYHMRMVYTLLENYPRGMFYNPLTNYPSGSYIHFGPLFDQMIAFVVMIIGAGSPGTELVNTFGAYFPAILGALTVIPVYFIGKYVGGHKTGIIAALLIAVAPGQFLSRSIIGFTDHHAAETLFSTLFMMFFMLSAIKAKEKEIGFIDLKSKDWKKLKSPFILAAIAGVMYAAFQLIWPGAPLFGLIIVIFAAVQYTIDHLNNRSTDYLGMIGITTFLIGMILIAPFIHPEMGVSTFFYSWFHVISAIAAIGAFVFMSLLHKELNRRKFKPYMYPIVLVSLLLVGLIFTRIVAPSIYSLAIDTPAIIFGIKTGGAATIAEASSIFYSGGNFTLQNVWYNFAVGFYLSIIAMLMLAYSVARKHRPQETLLLVWSFFILLAIYGQNRFAYYYSVNVAILSAYFASKILNISGWEDLENAYNRKIQSISEIGPFLKNNLKIHHILSLALILLIVVYPGYSLAMQQSQGTGGPNGYWIESLLWMNESTPDPGMDFYAIYEAPEKGEIFDYPDSVYGVMSWWDYGHWIETIGHRIPNANPFQAGIGGRRNSIEEENQPGASTFFTAQSEEEATAVLEAVHPDPDKAGARYVVSDVEMATGKFYAMSAWTLDTDGYYQSVQTNAGYQYVPGERYFNSMEAKLHIFDGTGLQQYRMVHESPIGNTQEPGYKNVYNVLYGGSLAEINTGYVKIFEYVEGAQVTGTAPEGETVTISSTIRTSQGRTFIYSQSETSDGTYSFTVPYSTEGPISGETQFDTAPTGPYTISYGGTQEEVSVSETDVLEGNVIEV
ncbi:oligosaccharyl transferase, archaeosortase A system-associated [Methanolobus zinderi]|uniref:dolichyl-phosphooligosaccharide-protein glycotransferase n=1 Tax=Methanolobus zinderi TaxID=536044 RepID=A0A7D5E8T1_9EURY|nr:oligosaccharyl transferase, archaeosortase A system-associated [Methanolobus zinderi]QLC50639.1 oligosaccharyl transferase, archaeosortase A system-associated [Methanolobus zinderi]